MTAPDDCVIVTKDSTTVLGANYFTFTQTVSKETSTPKSATAPVESLHHSLLEA
jgi:hypothetical protein